MSESDSDSLYNDCDRLYSDMDAVDTREDEESPISNGPNPLQSLGVNVVRLLLTYLPSGDYLRVAKVCLWLYTMCCDPALFALCCPVELALEPSTNVRKLHQRMQRQEKLRSSKGVLQVPSRFVYIFSSFLHVEEFNSRIVYFMTSRRALMVWKGETKIKEYDLPFWSEKIQGLSVVPEGVAILGLFEVVNITNKWGNGSCPQSERIYRNNTHGFAKGGLIRRVKGAQWVAVAIKGHISVYSEELLQVYYFPCSRFYDPSSILLAPSAQGLLYVLPAPHWLFYDFDSGREVQQSAPPLSTVTNAQVLPCEGQEQHYIVTLGKEGVLYADLTLLERGVMSFRIINQVLITLSDLGICTIYMAGIESVRRYYSCDLSRNLRLIDFEDFAFASACLMVTERNQAGYKVKLFSYEGKFLYTLNKEQILRFRLLRSKSELFIQDCTGYSRFLLDQDPVKVEGKEGCICKPWKLGRKH